MLRVRDELEPGRHRGAGVAAFVLALLTVAALVHVAVGMKGLEVAYDLGRERRFNSELEEQRRRLQIEIGMLKDPVRVVTIAREKLGMAPPSPGAIRRLEPGVLLTGLAPAPGDGESDRRNKPRANVRKGTPRFKLAGPTAGAAPVSAESGAENGERAGGGGSERRPLPKSGGAE